MRTMLLELATIFEMHFLCEWYIDLPLGSSTVSDTFHNFCIMKSRKWSVGLVWFNINMHTAELNNWIDEIQHKFICRIRLVVRSDMGTLEQAFNIGWA